MMIKFKFEKGKEKQVRGVRTSSAYLQVERPELCTIMYMLLSKLLVLIGRLARTGVVSLQQAIYRPLEVISISTNIELYKHYYTDSSVRDNTCHHATRLAHTSAADVDNVRQC